MSYVLEKKKAFKAMREKAAIDHTKINSNTDKTAHQNLVFIVVPMQY